jgi:hypothetical protein
MTLLCSSPGLARSNVVTAQRTLERPDPSKWTNYFIFGDSIALFYRGDWIPI